MGEAAHHTSRAHVYQAACGYVLLDYMLRNRKDIDPKRVGVMGGSGGGTHTVLLSLLDERVTASAPVVHLASHFEVVLARVANPYSSLLVAPVNLSLLL